jgi:hypothetical protein
VWKPATSLSKTYAKNPLHAVERELAKKLGHDDLSQRVPPVDRLKDGTVNPQDAGLWVLRAMIHAGLIKSGTALDDEGPGRG